MRVPLVMALLVLAGCAGTPPPSDQAPSTQTDEPSTPPGAQPSGTAQPDPFTAWEFVDCRLRALGFVLPKPLVEEELPPGYSLQSAYGDGVSAAVGIKQFDCQSLVIGNSTVVAPVRWAFTSADARAEDPPENVTGFETYQFEWFIDNKSAVEFLLALGFDAHFASINGSDDADGATIEISVDGSVWYRAQGGYGSGGAPRREYTETHYHGPDYLFAELDYSANAGGLNPHIMTLEANQGVLSRLGAGMFMANMYAGDAQVRVRLPDDAGATPKV